VQDLQFPIRSQTSITAIQQPFIAAGRPAYSENVYRKPLHSEFFDIPDSENFVVHVFGFLAPFMNLRLLKTYPHPLRLPWGRVDADYLDTTNGERLRVEWEVDSSQFIHHRHDPRACDLLVCWENDLSNTQLRGLREKNSGLKALELRRILHHYVFRQN
jgi:hypothetical protein